MVLCGHPGIWERTILPGVAASLPYTLSYNQQYRHVGAGIPPVENLWK